ncbi:hypothetical protein [Nocardia wallacei]|uniref:hypothetical protein n=1 Tax=Nocardia wallacei TaxID=480035 RepID=UPI002455B045|nr:hypothetical protein [Nocardia wallacei]
MNYPYGQPGYPAYGYPEQPAYGAGYPYPGYPPQPPASGGAAITAGILAILLSLLGVFGIVATVGVANELHDDRYGGGDGTAAVFFLMIGIEGLVVLLWLIGGILLMNRRNGGRVILITLSSLGLLGGLGGTVAGLTSPVPAAAIPGAVGVLLAVLMLALTLAGSTKRWCAEGRQPQYPPYPYY